MYVAENGPPYSMQTRVASKVSLRAEMLNPAPPLPA